MKYHSNRVWRFWCPVPHRQCFQKLFLGHKNKLRTKRIGFQTKNKAVFCASRVDNFLFNMTCLLLSLSVSQMLKAPAVCRELLKSTNQGPDSLISCKMTSINKSGLRKMNCSYVQTHFYSRGWISLPPVFDPFQHFALCKAQVCQEFVLILEMNITHRNCEIFQIK